MNKILGKSPGQVMVLYAGIAAVLVGAIALCADLAVMYVNWQRAQKTVDAAVVAGANYLKNYAANTGYVFAGPAGTGCGAQPDDASKAACTYAVDNGIAAGNLSITDTDTSIHVVATQTGLPTFFGNALGWSTYSVSASASAQSGGSVGAVNEGLFPVGLQCSTPCSSSSYVAGESVSFGVKFVSSVVNAPGNWDWLNLTSGGNGNGARNLGDGVQYGASGTYSIGDTISTAPGNKGVSGPVRKGLNARLGSCPALSPDPCSGGNPNNIPAGDPCLVIVPVVDYKGCTGNCTMTIQAFALVYLEPSGPNQATDANLGGCYINGVAATSISSSGAPSLGATTPPTMTQ
jgi:Putative Flp pilus-assembly TadE/G-like